MCIVVLCSIIFAIADSRNIAFPIIVCVLNMFGKSWHLKRFQFATLTHACIMIVVTIVLGIILGKVVKKQDREKIEDAEREAYRI